MEAVKYFQCSGGQYYKYTTEVTTLSLVALHAFIQCFGIYHFAEFDLRNGKQLSTSKIGSNLFDIYLFTCISISSSYPSQSVRRTCS